MPDMHAPQVMDPLKASIKDAGKSVTVEQQKLQPSLQDYLVEFVGRYPNFAIDAKMELPHIVFELERRWPKGEPAQARELWGYIANIAQTIPHADTNTTILIRISVATARLTSASLPEPHEAAVIATFDSVDGILRRYRVPVFHELPTFDDMAIPAGLIFLCQSVPPLINQFADMRQMGMGAGADIYGARSVDKPQTGNDDKEINVPVITPILGMPFGLGGPPVIGVPPMTQRVEPPYVPPNEENKQEVRDEVEEGLVGAGVAGAVIGHRIEERHIEQEKKENEIKEQQVEDRTQQREEQQRLDQEHQEEAETRIVSDRNAEDTQKVEASDIVVLAQEASIAEAEITSSAKEATQNSEGPVRPDTVEYAEPYEYAEINDQTSLLEDPSGIRSTRETLAQEAEASGAVEEAIETRRVNAEERNSQSETPTLAEGAAETNAESNSGSSETATSSSTAEAAAAGATAAEATAGEAVAQPLEIDEDKPATDTGAVGTSPIELEALEGPQPSDEPQELPVEEMSDALDKVKEQLGDEETFSTELRTGEEVDLARSEPEEPGQFGATTEAVSQEADPRGVESPSGSDASENSGGRAVARGPAPSETATDIAAVATVGDARAAASDSPIHQTGAFGSGAAEVATLSGAQPSDQSQEVPVEEMADKLDKVKEQIGDENTFKNDVRVGEEADLSQKADARTTVEKTQSAETGAASGVSTPNGQSSAGIETHNEAPSERYEVLKSSQSQAEVENSPRSSSTPTNAMSQGEGALNARANEGTAPDPTQTGDRYQVLRAEEANVRTGNTETEGAQSNPAEPLSTAQEQPSAETISSNNGQISEPVDLSKQAEPNASDQTTLEHAADVKDHLDKAKEQFGDTGHEFEAPQDARHPKSVHESPNEEFKGQDKRRESVLRHEHEQRVTEKEENADNSNNSQHLAHLLHAEEHLLPASSVAASLSATASAPLVHAASRLAEIGAAAVIGQKKKSVRARKPPTTRTQTTRSLEWKSIRKKVKAADAQTKRAPKQKVSKVKTTRAKLDTLTPED